MIYVVFSARGKFVCIKNHEKWWFSESSTCSILRRLLLSAISNYFEFNSSWVAVRNAETAWLCKFSSSRFEFFLTPPANSLKLHFFLHRFRANWRRYMQCTPSRKWIQSCSLRIDAQDDNLIWSSTTAELGNWERVKRDCVAWKLRNFYEKFFWSFKSYRGL